MSFQIKGLPVASFAHLFDMSDAELAVRQAVRVTADRHPGFPCRVSLRDARAGESLLLVNYEHLPVATPFTCVRTLPRRVWKSTRFRRCYAPACYRYGRLVMQG